MSPTNGNDGPFIVELRRLYDVTRALVEQWKHLGNRVKALEGQVGAVLPGWDAFNELEGRIGEVESWVEDMGPRIKTIQEKIGLLEAKQSWKYVGVRGKTPPEMVVCFTQTSPLLSERTPWEMPLEAVRLLVTKNYVAGGLDLDGSRRTTDGRTIPQSLEESIESLSTNKPALMFEAQLRQLINSTGSEAGGTAQAKALAKAQGQGEALRESPKPDKEGVGVKEYLRGKPLSSNEEAVLGFIERNGGISKDDIKALGAYVKGELPRDILLSLATRGLIEKVEDEDGTRFILTEEEGEGAGGLGDGEESPPAGGG